MGTRCLTIVRNYNREPQAVMYRQSDGYPDGHGAELAEFMSGRKISNGLRGGCDNGAQCLGASLFAHFKEEPGGFYSQMHDRYSYEDFRYVITCPQIGEDGEPVEPFIAVIDVRGQFDRAKLFEGKPSEFSAWIAEGNFYPDEEEE